MIQDGDTGEVDQHEPHQKVIFLFIVDHFIYTAERESQCADS